MSLHRFILSPAELREPLVVLSGNLHRHAAKVLRLREGEKVLLSDGEGNEWEGIIRQLEASRTIVEKGTLATTDLPESLQITIYQGLPKGEKLDFVLQKGTELGAAAIVPFIAERTVSRPAPEQHNDRIARWQRIAREAARQSGRSKVPEVSLGTNLSAILAKAREEVRLILWEEERVTGLKQLLGGLERPPSVALLVGPEGGLSGTEASAAIAHGFIPVTLGRRILRTETAALAAVAILQFYWGDIG